MLKAPCLTSKNKRWGPRKTPEILLPRADVNYVNVKKKMDILLQIDYPVFHLHLLKLNSNIKVYNRTGSLEGLTKKQMKPISIKRWEVKQRRLKETKT